MLLTNFTYQILYQFSNFLKLGANLMFGSSLFEPVGIQNILELLLNLTER